MNTKRIKSLQLDLDNANTYEEWREIAIDFDKETGLEDWKQRQTSEHYDHNLIRSRLNKLKDYI